MKYRYSFLLFILPMLFFACEKPRICPDDFDMGIFYMLESSKDLFPYSDSDTLVIFKDNLGNEVKGQVGGVYSNFSAGFSSNISCLEATDETLKVKAQLEGLTTSISFLDLDLKFIIIFSVNPDFSKYTDNLVLDYANIFVERISSDDSDFTNPIPQIGILLDKRNNVEQLISCYTKSFVFHSF